MWNTGLNHVDIRESKDIIAEASASLDTIVAFEAIRFGASLIRQRSVCLSDRRSVDSLSLIQHSFCFSFWACRYSHRIAA
jgi:hypothetical protein